MRRIGRVEAKGRTVTVRLERGTVTITPRGVALLRHPFSRTQFGAQEAKVVHHPPKMLRRTGWVYFGLGWDDHGHDIGVLAKYGPKAKQDFAKLVSAGNWFEEVQA